MKRLTFIIIFVIQLLNVMAYDFEVNGITTTSSLKRQKQ